MKTVALLLSLFMGSLALGWADPAPKILVTPRHVQKTLSGVIKSVSWADLIKGTKSEIVVKDAAGKTTNILVTSTTTLWDADTKAIMPEKILPKKKVTVIYITSPEGVNEAKAIKILK